MLPAWATLFITYLLKGIMNLDPSDMYYDELLDAAKEFGIEIQDSGKMTPEARYKWQLFRAKASLALITKRGVVKDET